MKVNLFNPSGDTNVRTSQEKRERATRMSNAVRHGNTALVRKEMKESTIDLLDRKVAASK